MKEEVILTADWFVPGPFVATFHQVPSAFEASWPFAVAMPSSFTVATFALLGRG